MNKYHNIKTRGYASAKEAERARELHLLEKAGKISCLREQVRFEIVPEVRASPGMDRYAEWAIVDAELAKQAAARQIREDIRPVRPVYSGATASGYHMRGSKLIERKAEYVADFCYFDEHGQLVVEDAKGMRTQVYILKRKILQWVYGIQVKEV